MQRRIAAFEQDQEAHWLARLDCGHTRHTRHDPPLSERPWVLEASQRQARIGTDLDCAACGRREMPPSYRPYRRTSSFTAETLPAGLRSRHSTKAGTWALIHVTRGRLRYRLHAPFDEELVLGSGCTGTVLPGVEHEVEPLGEVEFFIEFCRPPE